MSKIHLIYENIRTKKIIAQHNLKRSLVSGLTGQQILLKTYLFSITSLQKQKFWENFSQKQTTNKTSLKTNWLTKPQGNKNLQYFWRTLTSTRTVSYYPVIYFYLFLYLFYNFLILRIKELRGIHSKAIFMKDESLFFIVSLLGVTYIDALITDDEPLNDPVEWSLIQSWVLAVFGLAWVAENLISSRYGSYTGRDKRVWVSWYKTFWLVEGWYVLSLGAAAVFVITPFYNELSYNLTMVAGWWNWYTRTFFFTFISLYSLVLYISYYTQINLRYMGWKKVLFLVTVINLVLGYLLYSQFLISFFSYQTDPNWYHKSRFVDYVQLSHEPNKWAWGAAKRDHFSYHRSTTVFWFKTDLPMAAALMLFNVFFFICLFFLYIYWVILFRRIYSTQEVTYTYFTYCVSSLRQFFYYLLLLYVLICLTYAIAYCRLPVELFWSLNSPSWLSSFFNFIYDYPAFLRFVFLSY